MSSFEQVRAILGEALQLGPRAAKLTADTPLRDAMPELDSVTVVGVINALEEHFGIEVDDEEIEASVFATVQSLASFVDGKLKSLEDGKLNPV